MENLEISSPESRDRLSELPDSLIYEILGFLPMKKVVQTTILSKRWQNLWTTTPYLDFYSCDSEFVSQFQAMWRGLRILRFKFGYCSSVKMSVVRDVDLSWLGLAKDCGVEELCFSNLYLYILRDLFCVPDILYSCSLLKVVSLNSCKLVVPGNVQWKQIRSLTMQDVYVDEHSINQILLGSPRLEVFIFDLTDCSENLSIRSTSLKKLTIKRTIAFLNEDPPPQPEPEQEQQVQVDQNYHPITAPYVAPELRIWCPNLETLDFGGRPFSRYSFHDVSSLTDLTLDFNHRHGKNDDLFGERVWQIFQTLQHVEKLTISGWSIEVLVGALKDKHLLSSMSHLKFLTIDKKVDGKYEEIVDFLQLFPELKTLVFHADFYFRIPVKQANRFHEFFLISLLELRTVEITCNDKDNSIFLFIETLLKHTSKLEKMAIRVDRKHPNRPFCVEQKVLGMARSSSTAEFIFAEY